MEDKKGTTQKPFKIFVFDTETTGTKPTDRIVQFSGIFGSIVDWVFYEERVIDQYINPQIPIPEGASNVHWVTDALAQQFEPIEANIKEFVAYYLKADLIIGHNIKFDIEKLKYELSRLKLNYNLMQVPIYDTMHKATDVVKIDNGRWWYKRPKLTATYKFLFGEDFEDAHNSLADVKATLKCYFKLSNVLNSNDNKEND